MENNQPKKKNAGLIALIALLLIITTVASCLGIYAWAKYSSSQSGNATAQIAKWSFNLSLKNGTKNGSAQETTGPINLADTIDFTHVKTGTIAPGTNGEFQVIIDTSGTETDCKYDVTITLSNCPRNITFKRIDEQSNETTLSVGGASNERTRTLSFSNYLHAKPTNQNGKHYETITWNWPYESDADANWNARDNADNGLQTTMTIIAKGTEMLEEPVSGASITTAALGTYVNIGGTSILGKNNTTEADWRVFYKDANGAWLILADYLPNTNNVGFDVTSVGLEKVKGDYATYGIKSSIDRTDLINKLNENWSGLISGSNVAGTTGVQVKGAVDLPTWVASWNSNSGYTSLTETQNATGYQINGANSIILSADDGSLYFPHQSQVSNCTGYWLASPSASDADNVVAVLYNGAVGGTPYNGKYSGVRPAVYLPSNIPLDTSGEVWTIAQ